MRRPHARGSVLLGVEGGSARAGMVEAGKDMVIGEEKPGRDQKARRLAGGLRIGNEIWQTERAATKPRSR